MSRADYDITLVNATVSPPIVYLVDLANESGTMSITNDAEEVLDEVLSEYSNHRVVYKDTNGEYTEMLYDSNGNIQFIYPVDGPEY